ncbi:hypothetical protein D3C71_1688130 [compost metagenome]
MLAIEPDQAVIDNEAEPCQRPSPSTLTTLILWKRIGRRRGRVTVLRFGEAARACSPPSRTRRHSYRRGPRDPDFHLLHAKHILSRLKHLRR